jgi:RNA-binding protein YlmH
MTDEDILVKKRFIELAKKSYDGGYFTFTNFLGLAEQSLFSEIAKDIRGIPYTVFGGAEGAERVIVRFGSPDDLGYEEDFPIKALKISPKSEKFADRLSHRDFLGSLMNLGIEREMLGDIVIIDNVGYLFAKEEICEYICSSLTKIKHTDVRVSTADSLPDGELYRTEMRKIQLSSERLDAVIAKTFSLSRDDAQALFKRGLIFVNGKCIESTSYTPKAGDVVSARGHGRLIYRGYDSTSKKGKLNVSVELYV